MQSPPGSHKDLKPRRDVDAVAEDVVAVDDDVADVDADAKHDALVLGLLGIAVQHAALDSDRASDRVDHAGKLDEQAVAGGLDDAAAMAGDGRIDQLATMSFQRP